MPRAIIADDDSLLEFARVLRIPKAIMVPVLVTYRKWLSSMGEQETLNRLKAVKILLLSGNLPDNATWIATHPDGSLKGPFRPLTEKWFGRSRSLNLITAMISCMKSESLTPTQWTKFYSSAHHQNYNESVVGTMDLPEFTNCVRSWRKIFIKYARVARFEPTDKWVGDGYKSAVLVSPGTLEVKSVLERDVSLQDHWESLKILKFPLGVGPADCYMAGCGIPESLHYFYCGSYAKVPEIYSGRVAIIQERGLKARIIANPLRVHQMALSRLGGFLFKVIRHLPWDCTYDQGKGIDFVSSALSDGKTVYCHDLSDATNNFPLLFQEKFMEVVADVVGSEGKWIPIDMRVFRMVARGKWSAPKQAIKLGLIGEHESVLWNKGQPLGLYPSFPLFALTHGFLLCALERRVRRNDTFRILGDDVVITDPLVSEQYVRYMQEILGVPISKDKSLISNEIGEFAGKVISKDGPLPIEKWKTFSKSSMFEVIRWLGLPGLLLVSKRYRPFMRFVSALPEPVGLGLNPKGLSVDQRVPESFIPIYEMSYSDVSTLPKPKRSQAERRRDVAWAFAHSNYTIAYEPPERRTDVPDPVEVDHINTLVKQFGLFLPTKFREMWEALRAPTYENSRSTENVILDGRFWAMYKAWKKRNRNTSGPDGNQEQ